MKNLPLELSRSLNASIKSMKLPAISSSPKNKSDLLASSKFLRVSPRLHNTEKSRIPEISNTACSQKRCGYVLRYAANTNKGQLRNNNEDRLSIVINIPCPSTFPRDSWPHSSFFGIYDGHGGKSCANFLKDNLHKFTFESEFFPTRPKQALIDGFNKAESEFSQWAQAQNDHSGSCAVIVMVLGGKCYIANSGDSRAILSSHHGEKILRITRDHKPSEPSEYQRIMEAGGNIVTHSYPFINSQGVRIGANISRVVPGNLAVSRCFGDVDIKSEGVIIHTPEIKSFRLTEDFDFILMGSDGIFDKLTDKEVVDIVWRNFEREKNVKDKVCCGVEDVMRYSMLKGSDDNISAILILFKGLKEVVLSVNR